MILENLQQKAKAPRRSMSTLARSQLCFYTRLCQAGAPSGDPNRRDARAEGNVGEWALCS